MEIPNLTLPLTGGCACGAVRYECTSKPVLLFLCHCRDCQRASGGPYAAVVLIKAKSFKIVQGELSYYLTPRFEGGMHKRGFCGKCGARLTGGETEIPKPFMGITVGSLDDSSWFRPSVNIFASQAQSWDAVDRSIPTHENGFPNVQK